MKSISGYKIKDVSSMRKLSLSTWARPCDPLANVQFDIDVTHILKTLESKDNINLNHVLIYWFSKIMHELPVFNRAIIGRSFFQRRQTRIFVPTFFRYKRHVDLNGIYLDDAHLLSLEEISSLFKEKVSDLRHRKNKPVLRVVKMFRYFPTWICRLIIILSDFLQYRLNISLAIFGLPNDAFGGLILTFLDKFDIKYASIPIFPLSRASSTVAVGKVFLQNNKWMLPLVFTFDHRYFDGFDGYLALKKFRDLIKKGIPS